MAGPTDAKLALGNVLWADAELDRVEMDYGDVCLTVRELNGGLKRVICEGYIGYELAGFWDEIVISRAEVTHEGAFLDRCLSNLLRRLGPSPLPSGNEVRNREGAMQLVLIFDDGGQLNIAMKGLRVEAAG